MADPIRPAPKPSKKRPAAKADAPAVDDSVSGVAAWTVEGLKANPAKLKSLLAADDGTPGKDVAVAAQAEIDRDKAAAPLVTAAAKNAKEWKAIHGKAATVTKQLGENLAKLRRLYVNADGHMDMTGRSAAYQDAANAIYSKAGLSDDEAKHLKGLARYYASDFARAIIREELANGDESAYEEWCAYYKLNPLSVNDRRSQKSDAPKLPAVRFQPDDIAGTYSKAVTWAQKALDAPGTADPTSLPAVDKESLRRELVALQRRTTEILAALDAPAEGTAPDVEPGDAALDPGWLPPGIEPDADE